MRQAAGDEKVLAKRSVYYCCIVPNNIGMEVLKDKNSQVSSTSAERKKTQERKPRNSHFVKITAYRTRVLVVRLNSKSGLIFRSLVAEGSRDNFRVSALVAPSPLPSRNSSDHLLQSPSISTEIFTVLNIKATSTDD